ncbi:kinase-like domain-containing protein [Mycena vitilis]|nr:kinase-like domain-containing protein [Mycena vitilis]KAJ6490585.1 kinase-like domain-containing protein [Mycena vitilis]
MSSTLTRCIGKELGDGCNGDYPRKDFEGLCARCIMLDSLAGDPTEYARRAEFTQCLDCGAAAKNFTGHQCGTCRRLYETATGQRDPTLVLAEQAFGQAFQEKMNAGKAKKKLLAANATPAWAQPVPVAATSWKGVASVAPSLELTTSNLNQLRNSAKGKLGRMITVNMVSIIGNANAVWLPDVSSVFHEDTPVGDITQNALDTINETWETSSGSSLVRRDVFLLWHKNQSLLPGALEGTIGELYDQHREDYNFKVYFENIPQKWRHLKGESVCFNLLIDVAHFESRTNTAAPHSATGKRAAPDGGKVAHQVVKRVRTSLNSSVPVASTATGRAMPRRTRLQAVSGTATKISLHVASVVTGVVDGQVTVDWDSGDKREAILDDEAFAAGKTKKVYHISLGGKKYVAKRFFEIGNGRDVVSMDENSTQLTKEMIRLAQGQWFLNKFYERAEETSAQVSSDFMFSDGLLVQEIIGECALTPSPASGVPMPAFLDMTAASPDGAITWLLEPLRASSVDRWSGTLEHRPHSDKAGRTIDAFMHFAYIYSQQSLIFADLQSTRGRAPSGEGASILFDVMTHTHSQDSGVGDHGPSGIKSILDGHACSTVCDALQMGEEHALGREAVQAAPTTRKAKVTRRSSKRGKGKRKGGDSSDSDY